MHTILKNGSASLRKPEAHKRLRSKGEDTMSEMSPSPQPFLERLSDGLQHLIQAELEKQVLEKPKEQY